MKSEVSNREVEHFQEILNRMKSNCSDNSEDNQRSCHTSIPTTPEASHTQDTEKKPPLSSQLEEVDDEHTNGGFELNLAEFPITHLTNRVPKGVNKTRITYSDTIVGRNNKIVKRDWEIMTTALDKNEKPLGLGGPTCLRLLFEIFQIWKEQHYNSDKIYVGSYYNLLKRMNKQTGGSAYKHLKDDLNRLFHLTIKAQNAAYDKELGFYVDRTIKPFISWEFLKKEDGFVEDDDYGYIQVHPDFYKYAKENSLYFIPFSAAVFDRFDSIPQKFLLYLSKIFNPFKKNIKGIYKRDIQELCNELPIYGEPKKRKYKLIAACKSLIKYKNPILEDFEVNGTMITLYNKQQTSLIHQLKRKHTKKHPMTIQYLVQEQLKVCGDESSESFYKLIAEKVPDRIIYESLSEAKADNQQQTKPAKLYTTIITREAQKYLNRYLKKSNQEPN